MPRLPKQLSFTDHRMRTGRGGPRPGAGRKPGPRPRVRHVSREDMPNGCPVHVTVRVRRGIPSLRCKRMVKAFRRSLAQGSERGDYRVVAYSLQRNHVHLVVEASGKDALAAGMMSTAGRLARAVNWVFRRNGNVVDGRFHSVVLRTPRQVRNALRYVLLNWRKHEFRAAKGAVLDPCSSGRWFSGWKETGVAAELAKRDPVGGERETALPQCWLLPRGWHRHGRSREHHPCQSRCCAKRRRAEAIHGRAPRTGTPCPAGTSR
jgi:REP element-mobilizing transposase RayT